METLLSGLADSALHHALRQGAKEVAVGLQRGRFIELKRREGRIETLQSSTGRGLSIALYADGRYSSNATSFLEEEQVRLFIDETLTMTRKLAPDPHRALPDPALYGPAVGLDLDLEDPGYGDIDMDWRMSQVTAVEEAARAAGEAVISATAHLSTRSGESLQIHSNGFRGERRGTSFSLGATVTVCDVEGRRPEDHHFVSVRHLSDLPDAAEIGREAARRALCRIGSRKVESKRMVLVVENRAASRLVGSLLEPLSGAALQQRRSCFEGRLGQTIGSNALTLLDDPFLPRGLGSRAYDDEGLMPHRLPVVTGGRLDHYFVDVYYGRKLGRPATTGSTSNLILAPGAKSPEEMVGEVKEGILVSGFLGGNSNPATGDFSFGVMGFYLRDGVRETPVSEMNITGSHLDLWHRLQVVGNDPYPYSSWRMPTLLFEDVQFSGV
jgi:PmbA protein